MDENQMKAVWVKPETNRVLKDYWDEHGKKMIFVVEQLLKEKLKGND